MERRAMMRGRTTQRLGTLTAIIITLGPVSVASRAAAPVNFADKAQVTQWIKDTETLIAAQKLKEASALVEGKLQEYKTWPCPDPKQREQSQLLVVGLYSEVGRVRLITGQPQDRALTVFMEAVKIPSTHFPAEQAWILNWLCDKITDKDYQRVLERFRTKLSKADNQTLLVNTIKGIVAERPQVIPGTFSFRYLAPAFTDAPDPVAFAKAVQGVLGENEPVKTEFLEWCRPKAKLAAFVLERDIENADKFFAQGMYDRAEVIYRSIMKRSPRPEDYAKYHLRVCQCLMEAGRYEKAALEVDVLIKENPSVKEVADKIIPEAVILKGRCLLRLGKLDRAAESFAVVLRDCSKSPLAPDAKLLAGYCLLRTGKIKEGQEALNRIVKEHPDTGSACKAKLYLEAMKRNEKI